LIRTSAITSLDNSRLRAACRLKRRKHREETGRFLVEGTRAVEGALRAGASVRAIFVSDSFLAGPRARGLGPTIEASGAKVYRVPDSVLKKVADTSSPQGIVAVVQAKPLGLCDLAFDERALLLLCDRIQDPGNLGTMVRVADAARADAVLLGAGCTDLHSPKTVRATMGSLFHLPVVRGAHTAELVGWVRSQGVRVVGTSPRASLPHYAIDARGALCWVVGNEAHGLSNDVLEACDEVVGIPIPGRAESLNVAVTAAILMFETIRQRMTPPTGAPGK